MGARCNLTDDDLSKAEHWMLEKHAGDMAEELLSHRRAQAADVERIKAVVERASSDELGEYDNESIQEANWSDIHRAIATRAAEQLASVQVVAPNVGLVNVRPTPQARIEAALTRVGAEHEPPAGWQDRVWAEVEGGTVSLSREEAMLAHVALGFWRSDYNDAPHDEIEALRDRLRAFVDKATR